MKHPSTMVPGTPSPDHVPCEETLGKLPGQRLEAVPHHTYPKQDFAQLLARYKRAGYEAVVHWDQTHSVSK